jgi:hypothetical protein
MPWCPGEGWHKLAQTIGNGGSLSCRLHRQSPQVPSAGLPKGNPDVAVKDIIVNDVY